MKLFRKNSNLCDHNSPTLQTDRETDRQTTCDGNTALCTKVHRAVKTGMIGIPSGERLIRIFNHFDITPETDWHLNRKDCTT